MTMRVMLLGAGYSAQAYARLVAPEAEVVFGTTRSPAKADALRAAGIDPVIFDGSAISPELTASLAATTHLVVSASPGLTQGAAADPLLRLLPVGLRETMPALRWAGYLSTVGVYGNHDGAWVGEDAELRPKSPRAVARVAAEQEWLAAGAAAGIPVAVLRLSGIYGPGRNALANLAAGTARRTVKPGQVFNRIHVEDIAGSLAFLGRSATGGIFNVTDDEPGPPQDVVAFAAALMGVEPPPELPYEEAEMSPMARSFWSDNKRVSNARLRAEGYRFVHPDYHHALAAMWRDGSWKGDGGAQGGEG
jgi:nucleoside-diphosphate-sugar epimerase